MDDEYGLADKLDTTPLTEPKVPKIRCLSDPPEKKQEKNGGDTSRSNDFDAADNVVLHKGGVKFGSLQEIRTQETDGAGRVRAISRRLIRSAGRRASVTADRMRNVSSRFPTVDVSDENPDRGTWSNQFEFFLSCLGYAVGLGNVWRFPYLCYENGGGAFLIPYLIMLTFCGLPLIFLELSLGQYSSEGPITIWKISPLFKGIGLGMVWVSMVLAVYYNMITGWGFYYLYQSLTTRLPWRCCDDEWASDHCISSADDCPARNVTLGTCINNNTGQVFNRTVKFSADEYFHKASIAFSSNINELGGVQLHLWLSLSIAWVIVFLVLMRGIKSFGKTVYFTSLFPYFILVILFIRGIMEPGAAKGIKFFLTPRWEKLGEAKVWGQALVQIFFSLSVCTGGVITLASYNKFRNNVYRDAIIVSIGNSFTSIFAGFVVFSILGMMAERTGGHIEEIVTKGPGLAFVTYPQAVTLLPVSPLWSFLFFFMLIVLALSSMFPTVENITTSIIDQFPKQLRPFKFWVTLVTCLILYLTGIFLTTNGGVYILFLMDSYGVGWAVVIVGLFEIVVIAWRYGANRVLDNIESMTGNRPSTYWLILWKFVSPVLLLFCLVFSWIDYSPLSYGDGCDEVLYPGYSNVLGWLLSLVPFFLIPGYAIYKLRLYYTTRTKKDVPFLTVLKVLTEAVPTWGPALPQNRAHEALEFEDDDVFNQQDLSV